MIGVDHGVLDEPQLRLLAADFARAAAKGDCIALSGDLGAGKSTFARAFIGTCLDDPSGQTDIPSPTFTLVQTYEGGYPCVTHFDLYRIADAAEIGELGLEEALETGVALVEWPERAAGRLPADHVTMALAEATGDDGSDRRQIMATMSQEFAARFVRSRLIRTFLDASGFNNCWRAHLTGDASARSYERISAHGRQAILMNAPAMPDGPIVKDGKPYSRIAHLAEDVGPFIAVAAALKGQGFAAPEIFAADRDAGLLIIENLGGGLIIDAVRKPIPDRYVAAIECLAALHGRPFSQAITTADGHVHHLPDFDLGVFQIEAALMLDWYVPRFAGQQAPDDARLQWQAIWADLHRLVDAGPKGLVLRDFHSPNVIFRPGETGTDRIGLIDFQDALWGHTAYDVASLVTDARVDVDEVLQAELFDHYVALRVNADPGFDEARFRDAFTILAAQRAAKILGIFVRLDERDHKPAYLAHLPRMRRYMAGLIDTPVLAPLRNWLVANGLSLGGGR